MNILTGTITQILQSGAIMLVDADVDGQGFSALLIKSATRPHWLEVGQNVRLVFKETEISLAKDLSGRISMRNRMKCVVVSINRGELLSSITLQYQKFIIHSAITTRGVDSLELEVGDNVEALVKANEISLASI